MSVYRDGCGSGNCGQNVESQVEAALDWLRPKLLDMARALGNSPITPAAFFRFELALVSLLREFGRLFLEQLLNGREGDGMLLPHDVIYQGQGYRRLGKKTRNAQVATLFGTICLWRFGYRFWEPRVKESCIFPLELQLGLSQGVTPALADSIARSMAQAGATQNRVLQLLKEEHGVSLGVKRLRKLISAISADFSEHRQATQIAELLQALHRADFSSGNRKTVIAVGRDGITLCDYRHRFFEVATAATVTVFDRAGKRLSTIFLAWTPELGQRTMSQMLTELLSSALTKWEGPLPTLAYVADSGGNESSYFEKTLRRLLHPRTGQRLSWQRVVDFYHAAERVWAMAGALFGEGTPQGRGWARRMLHLLKTEPRGAKRVLHSAATYAARSKMGKSRMKAFCKARNYIRKRTQWMQYRQYKQRHIPIGSGVTEAACKTIFTQRLKLSGMRWTKPGAQCILMLRTVLLSRTWKATYAMMLATRDASLPAPYAAASQNHARNAA